MNLYEKLNRLDDSLVESKRVVKEDKLTKSIEYDDDIDEQLYEGAHDKYELSELVKDSINHLVNDLGKDPMADDFADDVCADLENNYDIDIPQDMFKYMDWCSAVMSEVSRQLNDVEELTENRNNPYFAPYGYRDAAKVLNGKAPEYYYHLKEIEMDRGDGVKLARYAMRKGLPVMVDKNSDPEYPEFAIKGEYHWNDYFYPYPTAHEEDLVAWDGKMFVEEQLTEDTNGINSQIPEGVDTFLQDLAQMYGMFDYKDIMNHKYTAEEIKKLRNYERRFNAEIEYEGDEEADAIMKDIAEKVALIVKR